MRLCTEEKRNQIWRPRSSEDTGPARLLRPALMRVGMVGQLLREGLDDLLAAVLAL